MPRAPKTVLQPVQVAQDKPAAKGTKAAAKITKAAAPKTATGKKSTPTTTKAKKGKGKKATEDAAEDAPPKPSKRPQPVKPATSTKAAVAVNNPAAAQIAELEAKLAAYETQATTQAAETARLKRELSSEKAKRRTEESKPELIPPPKGPVTSGLIREALGLDGSSGKAEYCKIVSVVHDTVNQARLDWDTPWGKQDPMITGDIFRKVAKSEPRLSAFGKNWATHHLASQFFANRRAYRVGLANPESAVNKRRSSAGTNKSKRSAINDDDPDRWTTPDDSGLDSELEDLHRQLTSLNKKRALAKAHIAAKARVAARKRTLSGSDIENEGPSQKRKKSDDAAVEAEVADDEGGEDKDDEEDDDDEGEEEDEEEDEEDEEDEAEGEAEAEEEVPASPAVSDGFGI